jgi:putative heme transporter
VAASPWEQEIEGPPARGTAAAQDGAEPSAPETASSLPPDELVPPSVRYAAAWSWRILVIAAAVALLGWVAWQIRVVTFPLVVAALLAALLAPTVSRLRRAGWSRGAAAGTSLGGFVLLVGGVLTVVGRQVGGQFTQVAEQAARGIDEIQAWLADGPLQLSQEQISDLVDQVSAALSSNEDRLASGALSTAGAAVEVVAGMAIAFFATFFFLFDGGSIWRWLVALAPRAMKPDVDRAGRLAFDTLIAYVRSTVVVSTFDGVFVTIWLLILSVPLALPLGVLVFFGGFVPLVGAFVSGGIAVLVAFVTQGPVVALLVLAGIVAVQQIEAHLFAPLVMGRMVKVHPLAIVIAISIGGVVFGLIGAVVAVPIVAVVNTVATFLSSRWDQGPPVPPHIADGAGTGGSVGAPTVRGEGGWNG